MRNFYKPIQDKKVVVVVDGKSVTFTNEKGQVVRFLASDEDFSIKYNTGALGGEYCNVDEGTCAYKEPNPKDFVNGGTYTAYYIAYFTERKCRLPIRLMTKKRLCKRVWRFGRRSCK